MFDRWPPSPLISMLNRPSVRMGLTMTGVCLTLVGELLAAAEPRGLEYHLVAIAGDKAARCGTFLRSPGHSGLAPLALSLEESRAVSACITAAHRKKRGFLFAVETPQIDTSIIGGLVGAPNGAVKRFHYWTGCRPRRDDEPGPGAKCEEQFSTTVCQLPKAASALDPNLVCR